MSDSVIPLLIDTDPGIDDALALLLAWGSRKARVEVLTTVAGNTPLERGTLNVFRLLALRQPTPSPRVAAGAAKPLSRPLTTAGRYHGEDGLGDLDDWPPVTVQPAPEPAAAAMVEAARRHGGRLRLVALGPLTNVALALESDSRAMTGLGRLVAMGGAVDVPGNVTPTAEFNIHVDPEAATRVLAAGFQLDLVPLDATRQAVLERQALEAALSGAPEPAAARILAFTRRAFRIDGDAMYLHDPLAVAVALDPTLVEWEAVRLEIGGDGATRRVPGPPNCRAARRVDTERFLPVLLERLCPASW
jgi:purine nucleosidase/pyrimidine-specific ribonucleoside hydrolase